MLSCRAMNPHFGEGKAMGKENPSNLKLAINGATQRLLVPPGIRLLPGNVVWLARFKGSSVNICIYSQGAITFNHRHRHKNWITFNHMGSLSTMRTESLWNLVDCNGHTPLGFLGPGLRFSTRKKDTGMGLSNDPKDHFPFLIHIGPSGSYGTQYHGVSGKIHPFH